MNARGGRQDGFSLIEVITASAILTIVAGLAFAAFLQSNKMLSQTVSRTTVDDAAVRAMNRMVGDLRHSGSSKDSDAGATGFQQDGYASGQSDDVAGDDSDLNIGPGANASSISFRRVDGFNKDSMSATWTADIYTYAWLPAAAGVAGYKGNEQDADGVDNNNNGLVDEGFIRLTVTPRTGSARSEILAKDVLRASMPDPANPTSWLAPINLSDPLSILPNGGGTKNHGFVITRGAGSADDTLTIVITTAGRLEDKTIYTRQVVETVLLRN